MPLDKKLEVIIQRMLDSGQPDEQIDAVIDQYEALSPKVSEGLDISEPETLWGGRLKGLREGMAGGAAGVVRTLPPLNVAKGPGEAVYGLGKQAVEGAQTLYDWTTASPEEKQAMLARGEHTLKDIPTRLRETARAARDLATTDPEAFGERAGELTAKAMGGLLLSKTPGLSRPAAIQLGRGLESVSNQKRIGWTGAGVAAWGAGAGDPKRVLIGTGLMATPPILKVGGKKLREWGERGLQARPAAPVVPPSAAAAPVPVQAGPRAPTGARLPVAPSSSPPAVSGSSRVLTANERAWLKKQGYPDDLIDTLAQRVTLTGNPSRMTPASGTGSTTSTLPPTALPDRYGPGATTLKGESAQAAPMKGDAGYQPSRPVDPASHILDPQTSTADLRNMMKSFEDRIKQGVALTLDEQQVYARLSEAFAQRHHILFNRSEEH